MSELDALQERAMDWLVSHPEAAIRYLARRDLYGISTDEAEMEMLLGQAHREGPIPAVLDRMNAPGFWEKEGAGYSPKYTGSVWSIILLAQLGASARMDERIRRACVYLLEHALIANGQFSVNGSPSHTIDCLQGNLCAALQDLGMDDPRLAKAFEWTARSLTGEGVALASEKDAELRYYAYNCGPNFACGANNKLSCAWGGVKVMLALGKIRGAQRTPLIERAIQQGAAFFLGVDPATAGYPNGYAEKPSQSWWKFGFPVFYVTDLLQLVEALQLCGYAQDPRLEHALQVILEKRDSGGLWSMEYDYAGKTWVEFGKKRQPNPWVTLRALKVLKASQAA